MTDSQARETLTDARKITVPLDDLALVLYLPKPTVDNATQACNTCGNPGGAHHCKPREHARHRLERLVTEALS